MYCKKVVKMSRKQSYIYLKLVFVSILPLLLLFSTTGCSSQNRRRYSLSKFKSIPAEVQLKKDPVLWMFWQPGQDFHQQGQKVKALEAYDQEIEAIVRSGKLQDLDGVKSRLQGLAKGGMQEPNLLNNIIYRLTNLDLLAQQPQKALKRLSLYYDSKKISTSNLSAQEALFLGFVYGSVGNYFQSVAWFDNARALDQHGQIGEESNLAKRASEAIRRVLSAVPDSQFESLADKFSSNPFISALVGKELIARKEGGRKDVANRELANPFGLSNGKMEANREVGVIPVDNESFKIIGLLPLSGRYEDLGVSVRRGIELAFANSSVGFVDSEQGLEGVLSGLGNMHEKSGKPLVVIGPLLNKQVKPIVAELQKTNTKSIVLARGNDIPLGEGVYRLAYTIENQAIAALKHSLNSEVEKSFIVVDDSTLALGVEIKKRESKHREPSEILVVNLKDLSSSLAAAEKIRSIKGRVRLIMLATVENMANLMEKLPASARASLDAYGLGSGWFNVERLKPYGDLFTGIKVAAPFWVSANNVWFTKAFKDKYGIAPDFLAAIGYDSATLSKRIGEGSLTTLDGITGKLYLDDYEINTDYTFVKFNGISFE